MANGKTLLAGRDLPRIRYKSEPTAQALSFFAELAQHLDIEGAGEASLGAEVPFRGPQGLICRIETRDAPDRLDARPQVLLPLDRAEISRLPASHLLSVQGELLSQLGWMLGHSREGLLQISPLSWTPLARDVAQQLELGNAVGSMVMALLQDPAEPAVAVAVASDAGH